MNKNIIRIGLVIIISFVVIVVLFSQKKDIGSCTEYNCDVKNFKLSTNIEIDKNGEDFVKVSGNILRFVEDPLSMYDTSDNKLAYADDSFHLISQDSHSIYVDGKRVEMVGLVEIFGEDYDIYDENGEKIATVTFNTFNTNGKMYDSEDNLIADYNSNLFFNDFDVRIKDNCKIDEKAILMIFCSYFSDQYADHN